jgi:hypothetical protein
MLEILTGQISVFHNGLIELKLSQDLRARGHQPGF